MIKRVLAVLALIVGAFIVAPAAPAAAAPCNTCDFVIYDTYFETHESYRHDGADKPGCFVLPTYARNDNVVVWNNTTSRIRVYDNASCAAAPYLDIASGYHNSLSAYGWNLRIEAFYIYCPPVPYVC